MADLDRIYDILVGTKVYDDGAWHVYDKWGAELSDPGGIMWRSSPGALLMWPKAEGLPEWDTSQGMAAERKWREIRRLQQEDSLVVDLIIALVTKGFFNGYDQDLRGAG